MLRLVQVGVSCNLVNDSQRLLLEWFDGVRDSPSQVYHFALQFCPPSSWLHRCYAKELSQEVKVIKGLPVGWGICFRTVTGTGVVLALTCWKDTVAVGLYSGNIVTLDGVTGIRTAVLSGHTEGVKALSSLPDGKSLVSGSSDKTVKLWDVQTGGVVKTFCGHTHCVNSVSISANCTMIASGSQDKVIHLWDIHTGECLCIIQQQEQVDYVRFFPTDPQCLVSVSGGEVWHWDINGHQTKPSYNGSHIAFSSDGTQFFFHQGEDVIVQTSIPGEIVARFHVGKDSLRCCCSSTDGRLIAATTYNTVYVWDITSSYTHPLRTFVGHSSMITSLAFLSPSSLVSSSSDGSVKFWQVGTLQTDLSVTDLESAPLVSAWIRSITLQAEDGVAISSDSEGVVRTWDISTGHCKASFQTPARGPYWGDVRLINNWLIFVWYLNQQIHIWDVERGEFLHTVDVVEELGDCVDDVRISEDGTSVFCLCRMSVQAWFIQTGEVVGKVGLEGCEIKKSFVIDGSRVWVWVHSHNIELLGWDFGIPGSPTIQLSGTYLPQPNNIRLGHFGLEDTVTGKVVFRLVGRFENPFVSQWDGRYLVAGYFSGEVLILDFN